jgi:C4-type Zn-finger protein
MILVLTICQIEEVMNDVDLKKIGEETKSEPSSCPVCFSEELNTSKLEYDIPFVY